jgi:hypothetical protein
MLKKVDISVYNQLIPEGKNPIEHMRTIVSDASVVFEKQVKL